MAVVQISKIQVRRGQENQGSGLPQLSSGEIGWAVDTQKVYIGNGSVAEGAPQVGNTNLLTEHSDLFEVADQYIYKNNNGSIVTGIDSVNPVTRTLQARLDDTVSIRSFGATGDEAQDATSLLQRAIDQLYLNAGQEVSVRNRVILNIEAGTYTIKDTIRIPPHATIVGAGAGKTIIKQVNPGRAVFQTVSDESSPGAYILDGEYATQARNIRVEGLTLQVGITGSRGLILQSCRDSYFENITVIGPWSTGNVINASSIVSFNVGVLLNSKNGGVESSRNEFTNCHVQGFEYLVASDFDINDNVFTTSNFGIGGYGVSFGKSMVIDGNVANGTATGPTNNIFSDCVFTNISKEAILVKEGTYNVSRGNKFVTCGNDGGADDVPITPVINFSKLGNESIGDYFTRTKVLSYTQGAIVSTNATIVAGQSVVTMTDTSAIRQGQVLIKTSGTGAFGSDNTTITSVDSPTQITVSVPHLTSGQIFFEIRSPIIGSVPYIPEVKGPSNFEWGFEHEVTVTDGTAITLLRLPQVVNQSFTVDYLITSEQGWNGTRSGSLTIVSNSRTDVPNGTPSVTVSDEYDFQGDNNYLDKLYFDAILDDINTDSENETVVIRSNSVSMPANSRSNFKFKVKTKQTSIT